MERRSIYSIWNRASYSRKKTSNKNVDPTLLGKHNNALRPHWYGIAIDENPFGTAMQASSYNIIMIRMDDGWQFTNCVNSHEYLISEYM